MHSIFSDGTLTPEELIQEGARIGLKAMALTDHDTTQGLPRFLEAGRKAGIKILPGVEVSADPPSGTMHVLGYCIDQNHPGLIKQLQWIREGREARNKEILEKLNKLGVSLAWEEIAAYAGADIVARPHFAQAMIAKGYVRDKKEAFEKYLGKGSSAYTERNRFTPKDTLALIRDAKGVPVLAHPLTLKLNKDALRALLKELCDQGLLGVEVYYSEHPADLQKEYLKLAKEFGLIPTGGSDYHGANSYRVKMGTGYGSLNVPDDIADQVIAARPQ